MNREAKEQRIARLLLEQQHLVLDSLPFLESQIKILVGAGKDYYLQLKRKDNEKLEKIRAELESLRGVH
jgi:hypothetical protein